jgi:hypothetical protein
VLGRSYGTPEGLDEEDLDAELAGLEDELAMSEINGVEESIPSYLQPVAQYQPVLPVQSQQPVFPIASSQPLHSEANNALPIASATSRI